MVKSVKVKTPAQERAALRDSEQRRLDHAYTVYSELINKHFEEGMGERDLADLWGLQCRLTHAIRNQHIRDPEVKRRRQGSYLTDCDMIEGDF